MVVVFGLPLIMAANVAAVILFETYDAETMSEKARKQFLFEEHKQTLEELKGRRSSWAAGVHRDIADDIER
jgi:hypothetical protein